MLFSETQHHFPRTTHAVTTNLPIQQTKKDPKRSPFYKKYNPNQYLLRFPFSKQSAKEIAEGRKHSAEEIGHLLPEIPVEA